MPPPTVICKRHGVFTRSSKRPAIHVHFEYICWKFAGRLLDRVNTLSACPWRPVDIIHQAACRRTVSRPVHTVERRRALRFLPSSLTTARFIMTCVRPASQLKQQ